MSEADEIIEAMESTAPASKRPESLHSPFADSGDMRLWRDRLVRFIGELEPDTTAGEIVEALEEYGASPNA